MLQEQGAGCGQTHAGRQAVEERPPELVFQLEDLTVDRAGRDVQLHGCAAD